MQFFESLEDQRRRKVIATRCGHVKRRLIRNQRLKGKTLEFAISVVGADSVIAAKLEAGQKLGDYELHLMLDVYLLHKRLGPLSPATDLSSE